MSLGEILSCLREDCRKVPNMQNNNSSSGGLSCGTLLEVSTYSILTPRSRVLLQKLTGFQLVKKFPAFYGTRRFKNRIYKCPPSVFILSHLDPVRGVHKLSKNLEATSKV